jgi:hypothetical protein
MEFTTIQELLQGENYGMKLPSASCRVSKLTDIFPSPYPSPQEEEIRGDPVASYME